MRNSVTTLFTALALMACMNGAMADNSLPQSPVSMATVLSTLQKSGYTAMSEVKYDDGVYKAHVMNAKGEMFKVLVDAQTGKIIKMRHVRKTYPMPEQNMISLQTALQDVEEAGYMQVSKVEFEPSHYEVKAVDKTGKEVKLAVDAATGAVTPDK
ncbi:MAG: hypothetical protein A3J38_06275 [Gammaproteobacteria bacterium RIFCSPHIGHO2_12_FULL_45_9]|nr:MAG: hypothetical protein A3J38_06275 [Gammaproteobacteria bacterium RIFCSPHIGHO2_12_FULL_45_9]